MFVGGDHRVGIYAKENIKVGDEILYDYFYKKECAPSWARPHNEKASNQHRSIVSKHKTKVHESKVRTCVGSTNFKIVRSINFKPNNEQISVRYLIIAFHS